MTYVKCKLCKDEIYYMALVFVSNSDEYVGICLHCFLKLLSKFINKNPDIKKQFIEFLRKETKIKDGEPII